jgi:hypothetical protein
MNKNMNRIILILSLLLMTSCDFVNNRVVINKIANDNLTIESVDVIQESNYYNVITDLNITIKSSVNAWNSSPELGQYNRVKTIEKVTKKFLKKLNSVKYENDDKVIAYRFIKSDNKGKKYIGYTVLIFDTNANQSILYYDIKEYPSIDNYSGVKQLINKGLSKEINEIEKEYYKKNSI